MKLLVIACNYQHYVSRNGMYYLLSELTKITDLVTWHESGDDIYKILHQLNIEPNFILVSEYYEKNATKITGLSNLSIPYAISMLDLHKDKKLRNQLIVSENIRNIFSVYRDAFYKWYPEFKGNIFWLPHHVNLNIFKDYGLTKDIDFLLMGDLDRNYYPLRNEILYKMKNKPGFVYHKHPGYREFSDDENIFVREKYAQEINRAKIFFTCDSILHYPVAKYFEVLACKTLLLAPTSPEIEDLGFIPGVNFVSIDEQDFEEKAEYYLDHEKERLEIAEQGYEMVRARHSTAKRASELVTMIEDILQSRQK